MENLHIDVSQSNETWIRKNINKYFDTVVYQAQKYPLCPGHLKIKVAGKFSKEEFLKWLETHRINYMFQYSTFELF
jgi:hypothetical protein